MLRRDGQRHVSCHRGTTQHAEDHQLQYALFSTRVGKMIDIDADRQLRDAYNECVPVVEIDGKVRFRGRVDPVLLRRLIARAQASE